LIGRILQKSLRMYAENGGQLAQQVNRRTALAALYPPDVTHGDAGLAR